jgi:hypothetical protein
LLNNILVYLPKEFCGMFPMDLADGPVILTTFLSDEPLKRAMVSNRGVEDGNPTNFEDKYAQHSLSDFSQSDDVSLGTTLYVKYH